MKVTVTYDEKQNTQQGNWLTCNLSDMVFSLDKRLRSLYKATATAVFSSGRVEMEIIGTDQETVKPLLDAFQSAMIRDGFRLLVTYA